MKISAGMLPTFFRYEPESGALFWRERNSAHFGGSRRPDWSARAWNSRHAGKAALTAVSADGYLTGILFRRAVKAHAIVWALHHGVWPPMKIDHINGNPADNRIENLRLATDTENARNRRAHSTNALGLKGVHRHACGRFVAQIQIEGRKRYLGLFATAEEASAAYAREEMVAFGPFARRTTTS